MTEVKRANGTSSLPLKKPPSFSHSSSSYKHIYDDVFASPPQSRQQFSTIIDDDYAEMFGSSRSNNGTWNISYSSIPVLDLPPPSDMRVRSASGVATVSGERPGGEVDYGGVFGGDEYGSFGLPGGEELFEQLNKKAKSSSNAIPRRKGQTMETTRPEILRQSQNGQTPKSVSCQPVDSLREFEQIKNEDAMKRSGEISKTAPARDFSVDTYEREEAVSAHTTLSREVPVINDGTRLGKDVDLAKKHGKHSGHTSSDLENVQEGKFGILKASFLVASNSVDLAKNGKHSRPTSSDLENVQEVKFGILKASGLVTPNSVDTSHDTSQSTAESTNSFFQPSDSIKPFDDMNNEMLNTKTSEATCAAEVHAIHESTSSLHEVDSVQNNLSSEMPALKDETKLDFNPVEEQGKHSRNTSSELGESKRSDLHSGFQYKSSESISLDTSQDTHLTSPETGLSNMIDDDVPINLRRKKGRHSRITSLDLGDRKHSCDRDGNFQRKSRFGGSYSFDASHDPGAARVKVQPSMMAPSSSVPQFFPVESRYKISENSSWRNFGTNVYRDAADSPPSLDSQLDMNSAAAISASALQRALEEAAMTIQLAKEYLEREGQGSSKLRFKDTLKVYGAKDEQLANEMDKYQQTMMHDYRPPVDTGEQKLQFLKRSLKVKVENDNQLAEEVDRFQHSTIQGSSSSAGSEKEKLSLSERSSALENHHPSPVFEQPNKVLIDEPVLQDQKKTVQEEESTKETIKHEYITPPHSENDRLSVPERTSVLETGPLFPTIEGPKFVKDDPVFQDQKKFVPDKECIDERNLNMSKLIDERDRQEGGGEWEAKKHLNQLFYGVKNKIASFMAWQTDTETKEVSNETEAGTRSQLQSEEAKPDSLETENGEVCAAEKNQDASGYLGEHVEMEIGFLSEPVEPYENDSVCSNTSGEEKAESSVDLNPGVAASVAEDIMFYPFRTERVCPTDTEEEGVRGSQGCTEIEFTSVREQVLNEMKYEQLQAKSEEHCEMLDYICYKDSAGQADMYRHVDSNTEETNEILEEPHSPDRKDRNETTNEEDPNRSMDEECRDETIPDSYCTESTAERIEEKDNCGHEMMKETENWQHDADILKETYLEEIHGCREIERNRSQRNHTEVAADHVHGRKSVTDVTPTDHIEKIDEEVAQKASCNEVDEDVFVQTKSRCDEVTTEEVAEEATFIPTPKDEPVQTENDHIRKIDEEVAERASCTEVSREVFVQTESRCNEVAAEVVAEEATFIPAARDELVQTENDHVEDTTEQVDEETNSIPVVEEEKTHTEIEDIEDETDQVAQQATCSATFADVCQQTEDICFSEPEDPCSRNYCSKWVEEAGPSDETRDRIMEIPNSSVEPKMTREETVLFYDSSVELGDIAEHTDVNKTPQFEKCVLHSGQSSIQSAEDESTHTEYEHIEDVTEQVAHQEPCSVTFEDDCQQTENVCLSEAEEPCGNDESSARAAEPVTFEKKYDRMMHFPNPSLEPKETVQFYDSSSELDEIIEDLGNNKTVQFENFVLRSSQSGVYPGKGEVDAKAMESESGDILQNQTKHVHEEALNVGEVNTLSSQDAEKDGVEAVPKRRRWFNNGMKVDPSERPNILEGDLTEVEIDQEVVDESVLAGSVEIHADELHSDRKEVLSSKDADPSVNSGSGKDTESTPKRRRWFVKRGEEGLPVPPPLFQGIDINLEEPNKFVNETLLHSKSDSNLDKLNAESGESLDAMEANVAIYGGKDKTSGEAAPRRKRWFESGENVGPAAQMRNNEDAGITMGTDEESKVNGGIENHKIESMPIAQETEAEPIRVESVNDRHVKEMNKKEREKEKEKIAVERAIREARERAFAEARERAKRDALERPNAEVRQRGAHEKVGKVPAEVRSSSDKAAMDAKLRTERAAVERATAEARERAMQKALSEKTFHRSREQAGRIPTEKNSSLDPSFQSSSSFSRVDLSNKGEKYDGVNESAERRKARLERQSRTMERAANALEEKNRRDLLVQKEQAAKNMMADSLDAEVKRWCTGKEGNLRVLLSTLQYILGPESGWQAISLSDLIAATAVRKAYKKASLCVHPDKLQQRGATIQQKYICEKVYDLLKEAWSKFNPDDR